MANRDSDPAAPISLNLARVVQVLLSNPRGYRLDRLYRDLRIQPRTYRKYRELLRDRFPPFLREDGTSRVTEVKDGEHRYLRLVDLPETHVGAEFAPRIAAIQLARELLAFLGDTDVGKALGDLFAEFQVRTAQQGFIYRDLLSNLDRVFYQVPYAPKDYSRRRPELRTILEALLFSRRIEIHYDSASGSPSQMTVEPYSLVAHRGGLYLIARHTAFEEPRIFAVDRIRSVVKQEGRFEYPSVSVYHPRDFTEGCFGIFREGDGIPRIEVELIFADKRWLKLDLTEREWHPTQAFEELPDGRLRMTFSVNSMVEVWPWIRSYGGDVEVIRPAPVL